MKSTVPFLIVSAVILFTFTFGWNVVAQRDLSNKNSDLIGRVAALEKEVARLNRAAKDIELVSKLSGHWVEESWLRNGEPIDESQAVFDGGGGGSGGPVEWRLATDVSSQRWVLAPEPVYKEFGRFSVDATKSPAWLDFHITENGRDYVIRGIVTRTYKQARIAIPTTVFDDDRFLDPPRPTSFESSKENGYCVYNLVRESFDRTNVF